MEKAIGLIHQFFGDLDLKYSFDEEKKTFIVNYQTNDVIGAIEERINVLEYGYIVYAGIKNAVEEQYRNQVSEYLHRVNYGMINGNFEMNYSNGRVRYKVYVPFENCELSKEIVDDSIRIPVAMFQVYGKNLIALMVGDNNPKKLQEIADGTAINGEE